LFGAADELVILKITLCIMAGVSVVSLVVVEVAFVFAELALSFANTLGQFAAVVIDIGEKVDSLSTHN
jgi:hypothetical protein